MHQTPRRRVLLCSPSNGAIDMLVSRLLALQLPELNQRLVRVGLGGINGAGAGADAEGSSAGKAHLNYRVKTRMLQKYFPAVFRAWEASDPSARAKRSLPAEVTAAVDRIKNMKVEVCILMLFDTR